MPFLAAIPIAVSAAVASGAAIAGTAISVAGQHSAGNAAQQAGQLNANRAIEEATIRETQQRTQDRAILAHARANVGTSGVALTGSPLDVLAESARQAEMNALIIRRGGQLEAESQLYQGNQAKKASNYGVAGTILTGASRILPLLPSGGGGNGIDPLGIGKLPTAYRTVLG